MTAERASRTNATVNAGTTSYAGRPAAVAQADAAAQPAAKEFGIPEAELTPRVRETVGQLLGEVQRLRQELERANERLEVAERAADQDQLLPILNRRAFVRELTRHIAYSARYGTPASLVYFDLDGFKRINDVFGHAAGDAVLSHFAAMLAAHVRESDVIGRLGGDEFGVILAHAGEQQASRKASSLLEVLNANPARWNGQLLPFGVSYGALELKPGECAETMMARADEAMYSAKRVGR